MKYYKIFSAVMIIAISGLISTITYASQPIVFIDNYNGVIAVNIHNYWQSFHGKNAPAPLVATADLNGDGLDEYFLKSSDCGAIEMCEIYLITGERDAITAIAKWEAKNIALTDNYTNGIRDILVYNQEKNDFQPALYKWDAMSSTYKKHNDETAAKASIR